MENSSKFEGSQEEWESLTRRNDLSRMTDAEKAIHNAIQEVEKLPPNQRLTNCVIRLQEAKTELSNWVDNLPIKKIFVGRGDFGQAIAALKQGKRVAREGWNGKGMFIFMRPSDELDSAFIIEKVKSLPQSVKDFFKEKEKSELPSEQGLSRVKFGPYLCMYAADGSIVNGWLASQTDILAEDWVELD